MELYPTRGRAGLSFPSTLPRSIPFMVFAALACALCSVGCDVPLTDSGEYFRCPADGECGQGYECRSVEGIEACVETTSDVGVSLDAGDSDTREEDVSDTEDTDASDTSDTSPDSMSDADDIRDADDADADTGPSNPTMDLVFVIDNSGTMCQEHEALNQNLDRFLSQLDFDNIDLQVGVTTTHQTPELIPDGEFEARFGEFVSRPVALPTTFGECGTTVESMAVNVERAVGCTKIPANHSDLLNFSGQDELCIRGDDSCPDSWRTEQLFPPEDAYRELPPVLRTEAYRTGGDFDLDAFIADLRCTTFVGTRGWSFEKGLGAAVESVSAAKLQAGSPNAGFVREDTRFGVIFVTDENDCTHRGVIDEQSVGACLDDVCAFENRKSLDPSESKLVPIAELKSNLLANLRDAKGREVVDSEVFTGGIYGTPERYDGPSYTNDQCQEEDYTRPTKSCSSTDFGDAWSGDRYHRFIGQFPEQSRYPGPGVDSPGQICLGGDFGNTMQGLGSRLNSFLMQ